MELTVFSSLHLLPPLGPSAACARCHPPRPIWIRPRHATLSRDKDVPTTGIQCEHTFSLSRFVSWVWWWCGCGSEGGTVRHLRARTRAHHTPAASPRAPSAMLTDLGLDASSPRQLRLLPLGHCTCIVVVWCGVCLGRIGKGEVPTDTRWFPPTHLASRQRDKAHSS